MDKKIRHQLRQCILKRNLKQTREAAQCTQELCSILEENPPPWKAEAEWIALDPQGETAGDALGEPPG